MSGNFESESDATLEYNLYQRIAKLKDSLQAIENACNVYLQQTVKGKEMSEDEKKHLIFIRNLASGPMKENE